MQSGGRAARDRLPEQPWRKEMRGKLWFAALAVVALGTVSTSNAAAQMAQDEKPVSLELRGIVMVPTFDIADAANVGYGGGAGIGYRLGEKFRLMADFDVGIHGTDTPDFNINTYHYMGKFGFDVINNERLVLTLNLGAGAMTFGGDLPESKTYFAINAGAKLGIKVSPAFEILISPQGDIAFSKEADVGTTNSWVWPIGAGFRVKF